jgi:hypothetical protein
VLRLLCAVHVHYALVIIPFRSEARLSLFSCSVSPARVPFLLSFLCWLVLIFFSRDSSFAQVLHRWAKCSPWFGSSRWLHWTCSPAQFFLCRFVFLSTEGILSAQFSVCVPFSPGQELPRFDFSKCFPSFFLSSCMKLSAPPVASVPSTGSEQPKFPKDFSLRRLRFGLGFGCYLSAESVFFVGVLVLSASLLQHVR